MTNLYFIVVLSLKFNDLFDKYDINSKILKVNEQRANIVAEIGSGSPILALSGHMAISLLFSV
jgi:hypothetical protein